MWDIDEIHYDCATWIHRHAFNYLRLPTSQSIRTTMCHKCSEWWGECLQSSLTSSLQSRPIYVVDITTVTWVTPARKTQDPTCTSNKIRLLTKMTKVTTNYNHHTRTSCLLRKRASFSELFTLPGILEIAREQEACCLTKTIWQSFFRKMFWTF